MKLNWFSSLLLTLGWVGTTTPSLAQPVGLNYISALTIRGNGKVEIKRPSRSDYQRAFVGDLLSPGDRIRVSTQASARVMCANLKIWQVPVGKDLSVAQGCNLRDRTVLRRSDRKTTFTRSGENPTIPYVISPRNTTLLSQEVTIRWHPVVGATQYQVQVTGCGIDWSKTVSQTEAAFSAVNQPITPGFRCQVTVTANTGVSSIQDLPVSFAFLDETQAQKVKQEIVQVKRDALSPEIQILTLGYLYQSYALQAEAIDLLEVATHNATHASVLDALLGSLYQQVGLPRLAKERYLKALTRAKTEQNVEMQAEVHVALGTIEESLGQEKIALQWYRDAQINYRLLKDDGQIEVLQEQIDHLLKRLS
ncbi:MAG: hypothetical protein KME16_04620 [Scytolyngbya sp. HA4215-MV1]|jgi:hypothetical protein|nr:hypothetical protein [Scytolyngbya sp. HA4215-MV1]